MSFYRLAVSTSMGRFMLEANEAGLSRVIFPEQSAQIKDTPRQCALIESAAVELQRYFSGDAYDFKSLTYDFSEVTDFQEKILRTLLTATQNTLAYSDLAEMSGHPQSSRAV